MRIGAILKSINLLNLILISVILLFSSCILLPMLTMRVAFKPPAAKQSSEEKKEETPAQTQVPTAFEYTLIAEQNLFHPERKIPEKKDEEKPKPEFILYGTLISDDINIAYMDDKKAPHNTPGRGKRQKTLRLGTILSGYTLSEVYHDRVVMVKGDDKIEVKVLDAKNKPARAIETTTPIATTEAPVSPKPTVTKPPRKAAIETTAPAAAPKPMEQPSPPPARRAYKGAGSGSSR